VLVGTLRVRLENGSRPGTVDRGRDASPLSLLADETLLFVIRGLSFFPFITAGVAVTEAALLQLLASRAGKSAVKRIDQAEAQLFESGPYLRVPGQRVGDGG